LKPDLPLTAPHEELNRAIPDGIQLLSVYRSLLKIVAGLEEQEYTESDLRQIEVVEHPNPADPASE
jgi:hypothetical protein